MPTGMAEKYFNVTGCCNPARHYMADISTKFAQILKMVERGDYFAINRPRQYGKTTMLNLLFRQLRVSGYATASLSFEGIGDDVFKSEKEFSITFLEMLADSLRSDSAALAAVFESGYDSVVGLKSLSRFLIDALHDFPKLLILIVDEVDKASNNQLFVSFLGMLRDKYLRQDQGEITFHSVILAGVHDVKSLKLRLRDDGERKLNSPWNIAADFNVDMSFSAAEITPMLEDYARERGVSLDAPALAERIHYYTNGYPFLVSKLCKNIDEEAAENNPDYNPKQWTLDDLDWAFRWLTRPMYTTTNFEDMIKNLENNQALYDLIRGLAVEGEEVSAAVDNPVVSLGVSYGILAEQQGRIVISNRVYEQRIATYLQSKKEIADLGKVSFRPEHGYVKNGRLDLSCVLCKFQEFMREHYSAKDAAFVEREGRLVFMSFLKPIINGHGYMWKEPVVGPERRMDIVVTYGRAQKEVVELKIWRGDEYHRRGLRQLADYLDFHNLDNGFLLIFDFRKTKEYRTESFQFAGKDLFAVWV